MVCRADHAGRSGSRARRGALGGFGNGAGGGRQGVRVDRLVDRSFLRNKLIAGVGARSVVRGRGTGAARAQDGNDRHHEGYKKDSSQKDPSQKDPSQKDPSQKKRSSKNRR